MSALDDLLTRRLLFTVGKGGVGRTTISLVLALAAARRGQRVLLVEFEGGRSLEKGLEELRRHGDTSAATERIEHCIVDGRTSLEEYLAMVVPVRRLLDTIFRSAIYQYFVAAAPGLKELMAIGKIWFEAERKERDGEGPDLVIVDAPATGHGLQYLRMPQAAAETFGAGLVHREAERVAGLLRNRERTAAVLVTLPEEMPVREALALQEGLDAVGMLSGGLIVNGYHEPPCAREDLDAFERAAGELSSDPPEQRMAAETLRAARAEVARAEANESRVRQLENALGVEPAVLPFLFCEEFGPQELVHLASCIECEWDEEGPCDE